MNLLNIVKSYLPANLLNDTARATGASEQSISSIINASIPVVLGGLINKSTSESSSIFATTQGASNAGLIENLKQFIGGESSSTSGFNIWGTLQQLFGEQLSSIIASIANFSGVTPSIAKSVFGMSSAATLGAVGSYVKEQNLDAAQLSTLLAGQKSHISSWMPSGFDFSKWNGILGIGSVLSNVNEPVSNPNPINPYENRTAKEQKGNGWMIPIVILLILAALIWWLMKRCNNDEIIVAQVVNDTAQVIGTDTAVIKDETQTGSGKIDSLGNWISNWGTEKSFQLADGTTLNVGENSTEYKLYTFLSDSKKEIDTIDKTKNWISLDRVYFKTGKSVLTETSVDQIKNIGSILKNYPNASIKIGGYTDNTGDAAINKKVSDERAKIVAKELKKYGATETQVVEAVGYGPEHPIASNETEDGRAQNRRVDLKVASK